MKKRYRQLLAYAVFAVFLLFGPFYSAYANGASVMWSVIAVPVSWIAAGMGAFIAMWCMNQLDKSRRDDEKN